MPDHVRFARLTRQWRVIARGYRPGAAHTGAWLYLSTEDSPDPTLAERTARGWQPLAAGGVHPRITTGNHLTMLDPPHVAGLARLIEEDLQAVARP
jgi:thioesterase domain-containing protein